MIKIATTLIITVALLLAASLLLDLAFVKENWLRYAVVVLLSLLVLTVGAKVVWQIMKDLKNN